MDQNGKHIPEHNILDLRGKVRLEKPPKPPTVDFVSEEEDFSETPKKKQSKELRKSLFQSEQFTKKKVLPSIHWNPTLVVRIRALKGVVLGSILIVTAVLLGNVYHDAQATKASVFTESKKGLDSLEVAQAALLNNDRDLARSSLFEAQESFYSALEEFLHAKKTYGPLVYFPTISGDMQTGETLLLVGTEVSTLGLRLDEMATTIEANEEPGFISFFSAYKTYGEEVRASLERLHQLFAQIDTDNVDEAYQEQIISTKARFDAVYETLTRVDALSGILTEVLGFNGEKTYLLVFQNNQELRPTGGFMGSIAQVSMREGNIEQLTVPKGGSYDISGQIESTFRAPRPLQIVNPYFTFQDANWFPDFPTSARKITSLYTEAGFKNVDGVIAFTPDVLLDFIELTGPITLEEYDQEITHENFLRFIRDEIEKEKNSDSVTPKKVIADMMPKLINKVFSLSSLQQIDVALVLNKALQTKDMLVYATDEGLEAKITDAGFAGEQTQEATQDYISLIDTNIAGGKTSREIEQHILISSHVKQDIVENSVTITRRHTGTQFDPYTGVVNLSYLRLYVPGGSTFVDARDFYPIPASLYQPPPNGTPIDQDLEAIEESSIVNELTGTRITNEGGFTAFGNWMQAGPGESVSATFVYQVPRKQQDEWSLFIRKQPGMRSAVTWEVTSSDSIADVLSSVHATKQVAEHTSTLSFELETDVVVGVILTN